VSRAAGLGRRLLRHARHGVPADARLMRMAIDLTAAAAPGDPDDAFVERLHADLARRLAVPPEPGPAAPRHSSRRGVIRAAGLAAAAGTAGAAAGYLAAGGPGAAGTAAAGAAAGEPGPGVLRPALGAWQVVAASGQLPDGAVLAFDAGPVFGYVGRAAGRLFAVSGVCTHQGCRLALDGPARQLACPCHSATFTLAGAVIQHPRLGPLPPLPRLPVREAGGLVEVLAASTPPPPGPQAPPG
jgi:cytochrome b6-f complex iron-sulfur subunit